MTLPGDYALFSRALAGTEVKALYTGAQKYLPGDI